jgi:nitrite reductase/ring-hydroxylating ferredoxin subunit
MIAERGNTNVKHTACRLDEVARGGMREALLGKVAIVVVRTHDDRLYALRNICPHAGARLARGSLERVIVGDDVGSYALSDGYAVRCPWHGWEFDVSTGRCIADPERTRVRSYRVYVEDGDVIVER